MNLSHNYVEFFSTINLMPNESNESFYLQLSNVFYVIVFNYFVLVQQYFNYSFI